ncbi:MAG TPA: cytochrome P450 [Acidimicrobiia bacterium]|nr:cytochrome P450 [Acidimicrobiia bacterium]
MTAEQVPSAGYLPPALNPFEPGFFDDPYAQYRAVRAADPVHLSPIGVWALFRYEDVQRVLRDPRLSVEERHARESIAPPTTPEMQALVERRRERGSRSMLNLDPPDHHRLRRLVQKVFTPRMVESLRPRVHELVDELLTSALARDGRSFDVIEDLAFPLPFVVISEMMGIPEGRDRFELRAWSGALVRTFDPVITPDEVMAAMDAGEHMGAYLAEVIEWKRDHPADDLLSALIAAEDEGDRLTEDELIDQVALLFIAGHETTVNLVGNGTLALLRHREQLELLRGDAALVPNAIEELLRYDSPVQMSRRVTLADLEIGEHVIPAGHFVMTCLGAANHDPEVFGPDADDLDLRRSNAHQHVSFGGGVHHCLGSALARLEGQVAIGELVARFPELALATDSVQWNGRIVLRGLATLPVTVSA